MSGMPKWTGALRAARMVSSFWAAATMVVSIAATSPSPPPRHVGPRCRLSDVGRAGFLLSVRAPRRVRRGSALPDLRTSSLSARRGQLGGGDGEPAGGPKPITDVDWQTYAAAQAGRVPLGSATAFSPEGHETRAVKMALTSLQPLRDSLHRARFGRSLFDEPWLGRFRSPENRGLATFGEDTMALTSVGETLVEAVINTEF
jgi:hypothetical protein